MDGYDPAVYLYTKGIDYYKPKGKDMTNLRMTNNPDSIDIELESIIYFGNHENTNYFMVAPTDDIDVMTMVRYTDILSSLDLKYPDDRILAIQDITIEDGIINFTYRNDRFSSSLGDEHPISVLNKFILGTDIVSTLRESGL